MRPSLSCSLKTRLQHSTWRRPRTNLYCICKYFYFDLPFSLDKSKEVDEETAKKCEAFLCDLYPSYKKSPKTSDELRYIIFCQKKPNSDALPPTSDSLRQHINRANYQTHIWRKSLDALLELPSPEGHGWQKEDDELTLKLMSKDPAPTVQQQLFLCKCRSLMYRSLHLYGGGHV